MKTKQLSLSILLVTINFAAMAQVKLPENYPAFFKEGHRGGTGLMPENTIQSMKKGIDVGANVIELDVYTTKDKKVIVTHDPYINWKISLTEQGGELTEEEAKTFPVHQMNYDEIRKFDVGLKPYTPFPDQKKVKAYIPLLGELIDSVELHIKKNKLTKVIYNIELKTSTTFDSTFNSKPEDLVDAVMAVLKTKKIGDRFLIQSFDVRPLQYVHKKYPDVTIGYLVANKNEFGENIRLLGFVPHFFSPHYKLATADLVNKAHAKGCKFVPWTVNTLAEMKEVIAMGADGIITDYPNYFIIIDR